MKVLSLTEPYASLIKNKVKKIETRSWKTNYRGELFIHASLTSISKNTYQNNELRKLIDFSSCEYGKIICKCNLIDCIYMTKEFIHDIKRNHYQEYICGDYKEGRYAWILDDIVSLEKPIPAKGQLSIWNYYNEEEIMNIMDTIQYGFVDNKKNIHNTVNNQIDDSYILQKPNEVLNNKIGICWDQVELERYLFRGNIFPTESYFLFYYSPTISFNHTFLVYQKENDFYWFEHSFEKYKGIHKYKSKNELFRDVIDKFILSHKSYNISSSELELFQFKKPKYHINHQEFVRHCTSSLEINIKK